MSFSKKILKAINEGVLKALTFDKDELESSEEFDIQLSSSKDDINISKKDLEKKYYSQKLQEMRPDPLYHDGVGCTDWINRKFIDTAIEWHKLYGATYNPHLDNAKYNFLAVSGDFNDFIKSCLYALWDVHEPDLNWIDTSEVTSLYQTFSHIKLENIGISEWDVSNVKSMEQIFISSDFNGDLSKWDVSNVGNMESMFYNSRFNNNSICNWNTSNVKYMNDMFKYNRQFCQDLRKWDVSNVIEADGMFDDESLMKKELMPKFKL